MRIVVLTFADHMFANVLLRELVKERKRDVVAVLNSSVIIPRKSTLQAMRFIIATSGWRYFFGKLAEAVSFRAWSILAMVGIRSSMLAATYLRRYDIPSFSVRDINSPKAHALIKKLAPDVIVVFNFNQILRPETIRLAKTCINLHPSPLPRFGGVAPHFWLLQRGETKSAVTLHLIEPKVDAGPIITQKPLDIRKDDTSYSLISRSAVLAAPFLLEALAKAEKGELRTAKQKGAASYFSWPKKSDVARFHKKGRALVSIADLFRRY